MTNDTYALNMHRNKNEQTTQKLKKKDGQLDTSYIFLQTRYKRVIYISPEVCVHRTLP